MNANKERAKELFAKAFTLDPVFRPTGAEPAASSRRGGGRSPPDQRKLGTAQL